jgi:mRNA interferase RelE/StbE
LTKFLVYVERKAKKQIEKLPEGTRRRVVEALIILETAGFSMELDVKKLQGYRNRYRIRVGKHRVLFELSPDKTIVVYAVLPRETAYKQNNYGRAKRFKASIPC